MDPKLDKDLVQIKKELGEIRDRNSVPRYFLYGLLQGVGWIIGTLAAVALLGWLLSISGIVPGLGRVTAYLSDVLTRTR